MAKIKFVVDKKGNVSSVVEDGPTDQASCLALTKPFRDALGGVKSITPMEPGDDLTLGQQESVQN